MSGTEDDPKNEKDAKAGGKRKARGAGAVGQYKLQETKTRGPPVAIAGTV
jgi:hypothetical protein